ncbi:metallophosphoesterase [candidate division KSB1 bacterium]|nr:metallophosphoesterase [candidate division KSB1 bacterium]
MILSRFNKLYLLLIFISMIFITCGTDIARQESFRFVFMTDIHLQPERGAIEGFRQAIDSVNALNPKPDFVITGGDLIFDAIKQNEKRADSLYNLYFETAKRFQMPVYHTIGNHEIFGVNTAAGVPSNHPEYGKKMFVNRAGENNSYLAFSHKNWHFILLDAMSIHPEKDYIGKIDSTQIEWLAAQLQGIGEKSPVAFVTHIPFYTVFSQYHGSPTMANGEKLVVTNANDIVKLAAPYNLKLVLQGHLHTVEEIKYKGVSYITGGAVSGNWWKGARFGFPEGYIVVDVNGEDISWEYKTYGWDATAYN